MEKLGQFWGMVVEVWKQGVYGMDVGQVVVAIAILAAFILTGACSPASSSPASRAPPSAPGPTWTTG